MKRVAGGQAPWTNDQIIAKHRFTNAFRASDKVSQYLIKKVIYEGSQKVEEVFFRTLLFKIFNKIETWETLTDIFGEVKWSKFNFEKYSRALEKVKKTVPIYSAAYIMPSPLFSLPSKHRNHLRLLEHMMKERIPKTVASSKSLEDVYNIMLTLPSFGKFLAFQFSIDLNYSEIINFSEMDFVVAGPGARNGIMKCFKPGHQLSPEEVIKIMADRAPEEFDRLSLDFKNLWGRPLQLIDCQNLFCEVDKYARVAHPEFAGETKRTKIKQKYRKSLGSLPQWYPPKWKLEIPKRFSKIEMSEKTRPLELQQDLFF